MTAKPLILYTADLAQRFGKTTEALRVQRVRNPKSLPTPDGRIGRRDYWLPESIDRWLQSGGSKAKPRGRPRLVPAHINVSST